MMIWQEVSLLGIALILLTGVLLPVLNNISKLNGSRVELLKKKKLVLYLFISSLLMTLINPTYKIIYLEMHTLVILFLCWVFIKLIIGESIKYSLLALGLSIFFLIFMYLVYPFMF